MWCLFNSNLAIYEPQIINFDTGARIYIDYKTADDNSNLLGYYYLIYDNPKLEDNIILKKIMDFGIEIEDFRSPLADDIIDLFAQLKEGKSIDLSE